MSRKMNKADRIFKDNLSNILISGTSTKGHKVRPRYKDGTEAHTYFINQVVEKYDIDKGEFPITTLRPVAWKSAIKEMMVIFQDQLNTRKAFESKGVFWWESWMNEDGNIGRSYPYNLESHRDWEQHRNIVKIKKRIVDKKYKELKPIEKLNSIHEHKKNDLIANKYIELEYDTKSRKHKLQNTDTGEIQYVSHNAYKKMCKNGSDITKNGPFIYNRIIYGMGYIGDLNNVSNFSDEELVMLKRKWIAMLKRTVTYSQYKDIFVHQDWHSFEQFLKDIRYIPQYHLAKENNFKDWELDKDYYGSNCYSKDTCVFLKKAENSVYADSKKIVILIHPNNKKEVFINMKDATRKYNLNYGNLYATTNGSRKCTKGFKAEFKEYEDDYVYRYELSRNQVNYLLNGLINNPYERRHIVSFWNWQNIDKKELVECAYETVWTVRGNYLDMTLHQRSNDYAVAGHINKMQYVALLMMVARHVGLKPGVFMHIVENLHIYDRHIKQVQELLNRKPSIKRPKLILNSEKTNFYDFTVDDFVLEDYEPVEPQLKFELAI